MRRLLMMGMEMERRRSVEGGRVRRAVGTLRWEMGNRKTAPQVRIMKSCRYEEVYMWKFVYFSVPLKVEERRCIDNELSTFLKTEV